MKAWAQVHSWWQERSLRQISGGALALLGVGFTVLVTWLGSQDHPPSTSTQALIALLAIIAQVGAAWVFGKDGRADPALAERSVARLMRLAQRSADARMLAERLTEKGATAGDLRNGMGLLSVHLSYLEDGFVASIQDWETFHPNAVTAAERKSVDDE